MLDRMYIIAYVVFAAIILPTVWQYLNYLGATQQYMLGFTVSGSCFF